ncbi:hypothetical protein [Robertmurraya siralis]|nr:hypothetical protein [Robertmurraya siralis]PAE21972.1 hypothetical protein CHH80_03500 [Bacillus sp. 7504-2]
MMWEKIKNICGLIYRIILAISIVAFAFFVFITLMNKTLSQNQQILTYISLVVVLLSIPGIIDTFAKELNPKKKKYKLTCKCPKCKHLIQMDMIEE